jgi:hypothetical protein
VPLPGHIKIAADPETTGADTKAGFFLQARAKTEKAERYVEAGERLTREISKYKNPDELFKDAQDSVIDSIIAASGYSDKACKYFSKDELRKAAQAIVKATYAEYPNRWKQRLSSRYLLTRGDSLGGEMRNWIGAEAGNELSEHLCAALKRRGIKTEVVSDAKSGKVRSIKWNNRRLVIDRKSPLVGKNIDVILLDDSKADGSGDKERETALLKDPAKYLACGELKGGIDKAGADEHYKTANAATGRIRKAVPKVKTFFVGRAIEASMANEIYTDLKSGELDCAANLTKKDQIESLAEWLVRL